MKRVRRTFWALVAVAVLATGALSRTLGGGNGPAAGLAVALSGLVLAAAAGLALRILLVTGAAALRSAAPPDSGRRAGR